MTTPTVPLVESALRATYQLSPTGSGRLRRLTAGSGLGSENILSRVALMLSLSDEAPVTPRAPLAGSKGKEIKGATLLGRPGAAALLVAMVLRDLTDTEVTAPELRELIIGHWERGLDVLNRQTAGGSAVDLLAEQLLGAPDEATRQSGRTGGHGASTRDRVAAALGREFGTLPIEVRRLLAMVGRFDLGRAREAAQRLIASVQATDGTNRVSESQTMRVLATWDLNRLGMTAHDRQALNLVASQTAGVPSGRLEVEVFNFLRALGLVELEAGESPLVVATPAALALGPEGWLK